MKLVPFAAEHLAQLDLQASQEYDTAFCTPDYGAALVNDMAWSVVDGGVILACAGILPVWEGRAIAWALLSRRITPRRFGRFHLWVKRALDDAHARGIWRIETTVDPDFHNAVRWAAALGFRYEGHMRMYGPDRRDHLLVARIRADRTDVPRAPDCTFTPPATKEES